MKKNTLPLVKQEQLYKEERFIDYCNFDAYRKKKIDALIGADFLKAAEKDGLLIPLLKKKEDVQNEDGIDVKETVSYYSPFQLFMVAALSKNIVDEGHLRRPDNLEWDKQQGRHSIAWGEHSAFNAQLIRNRKENDYFAMYTSLHSFLTFLHGLDQTQEYDYIKQERQRYFSKEYPHLNFDFRLVADILPETLKSYKLNTEKLNKIRTFIGQYAHDIDPLGDQDWFYFLQKIPQWRKDKLQGSAILAQELYCLDNLLTDVLEIITGEKQKPLPEFLYPNIKPFGISELEHASGTDFLAIETSLNRFKKWLEGKENKKLIERVMEELSPSELQQVQEKLKAFEPIELALQDYKKRYGERNYLSGVARKVELEEVLTLDSLDSITRRSADSLISQHENFTADEKGVQHFISNNDEIMESLDKKKISLEEAIKLDNELEQKQSITMAIEYRLSDLQRALWTTITVFSSAIRNKIRILRRQKEDVNNELWMAFYRANPTPLATGIRRATNSASENSPAQNHHRQKEKFIHSELKKKMLSFDKQISFFETKEKELTEIRAFGSLALCSICRKSPVQIHSGHNDGRIVTEPICDDCFKSGKHINTGLSSWNCDFCDKVIYRFANQNMLHSVLQNGAQATISLEYGRLQLDVKCKQCGEINRRHLDWGWQA